MAYLDSYWGFTCLTFERIHSNEKNLIKTPSDTCWHESILVFYRHGTKCAGVIAAEAGNNKSCGVGLAYNARIGGEICYAFYIYSSYLSVLDIHHSSCILFYFYCFGNLSALLEHVPICVYPTPMNEDTWMSCLYAPVNSSCAHPPPPPPRGQLRGICTHRQSRGSGISLPKGYPRAFDTRSFWLEIQTKTILSEKTSSLSLISLSGKDWTKLWRFLKVCFLDFRHFLIVYQATTLKRDRERSLWLCISRSKRIPGVGHLLSSFIPTSGNLPPKTKEVLMPGG